ncbi:hypothetical protein ASA1KI_05370 [Opitutales bacterium ASA1]|uniref:TonB-dependent receptor n=1 Tax=Congregicoccus parvus TaxID=3081749 RepID=UPI002B2C96AA|nr:hypothetical protein ASA1KI_05370 [Opitutales bacterium ASA1]
MTPRNGSAISCPNPFGHFTRALLALVLFLAPVALVQAQEGTGTVSGRVQNANNGNFLNNARVSVQGSSNVVFTNQFGEFRLDDVPAGEVTLRVFYTGLEERTITVTVVAGQRVEQNVRLSASFVQPREAATGDQIVELDDFVIAATKDTDANSIATNEQRFAANIKNVVSADAFGDVTEGNIGEFVKFLPGISVDYVAADVRTISVRGFADNFTAVQVDGAQMASAASSGNTRSFELEQVSINNVSRIEVAKVPTPDTSAATLGGSVNMISKSAFERDRASFGYKFYLSVNDENTNPFAKSPGPGEKDTFKALPGFEFSYVNPVSDTFGFVLNGLSSNQFNEQHRSALTWRSSAPGSNDAPYARNYQLQDGPKNTFRDSIGFKFDWKPAEGHVVSAGYQFNYYKSFFGNRNINWDVGTSAAPTGGGTAVLQYGEDFSYSASGRGSVTQGSSFRDKLGATNAFNLGWKFDGRRWDIEARTNFSRSKNWYRDITRGHFDTVLLEMQGENRVLFDEINEDGPKRITVLSANGGELDAHNLSNYRLRNGSDAVRSRPFDSYDEIMGARIDARYDLGLAFPFSIKTGTLFSRNERDIVREENRWRYVGPDGIANNADDTAAPFLDTVYSGEDPGWGFRPIQWISPFLLYDRYVTNPEQFVADTAGNATRRTQNSYFLREDITALYAQAETKLLDGRLGVLSGVRYEKTENYGEGQLFLADTGERIERGATAETSYDGFYPSVHLTYNITNDVILRAAFAKTFGRPNLSNILPSTEINENEVTDPDNLPDFPGYISIRNTGLEPWQGNNYDLSIEYYTKNGGLLSAGVFRKEIDGFFSSLRKPATLQDLAPFGLGSEYVGWELRTTINAGDAEIDGFELSLNQRLDLLGRLVGREEFGRMFTLNANMTRMSLGGTNVFAFEKWIPDTGNVSLSFNKRPFSVQVKWNYRGAMRRARSTSADLPAEDAANPDTYRFDGMLSQGFWDLNVDYRLGKNTSLFLSGRNIFDKGHVATRYNAFTADYARDIRTETFGVQWSIGIKGSF